MSQVESSQKESGNSVNPSEVGKNIWANLRFYLEWFYWVWDMLSNGCFRDYKSFFWYKRRVFCVGEVDHEYYNAEGDVQNYASLDMTKVESKPIYESLINVERDLARILFIEM